MNGIVLWQCTVFFLYFYEENRQLSAYLMVLVLSILNTHWKHVSRSNEPTRMSKEEYYLIWLPETLISVLQLINSGIYSARY